MSEQTFFETIYKDAERAAAYLLDSITDRLAGSPDTLRNGTEFDPVVLPRDLAAHENVQTEWWYYTGHGKTEMRREFGFELVFFKRRTDLDRFSVVPLRLLGNPFYFAHFAVTDRSRKRFAYDHRKSANGVLDLPAFASKEHFYLRLGDWTVREAGGSHIVTASVGSEIVFEASLTPAKPAILNGENGVSYKDDGEASRYFSYTRMSVEGDITFDGKVEHFNGSAWMDREFGTWTATERQKGWDWFSIQLNNNSELMCYQLRDGAGAVSPFSSGTFVSFDSTVTYLKHEDFSIEPVGNWKSPTTGAVYPSGWRIEVESLDIDLNISPVLENQELDTRGTTMIVYWEGACRVEGTVGENETTGDAYVELVGYDRSHDQPNLARFLMGTSLNFLRFPG